MQRSVHVPLSHVETHMISRCKVVRRAPVPHSPHLMAIPSCAGNFRLQSDDRGDGIFTFYDRDWRVLSNCSVGPFAGAATSFEMSSGVARATPLWLEVGVMVQNGSTC